MVNDTNCYHDNNCNRYGNTKSHLKLEKCGVVPTDTHTKTHTHTHTHTHAYNVYLHVLYLYIYTTYVITDRHTRTNTYQSDFKASLFIMDKRLDQMTLSEII